MDYHFFIEKIQETRLLSANRFCENPEKKFLNFLLWNPGNKTPWTLNTVEKSIKKRPKLMFVVKILETRLHGPVISYPKYWIKSRYSFFFKKTLWTIVKIQKTKLLRLLKVKNKTQRHFYLISTMTVNYKKKLTL